MTSVCCTHPLDSAGRTYDQFVSSELVYPIQDVFRRYSGPDQPIPVDTRCSHFVPTDASYPAIKTAAYGPEQDWRELIPVLV